MEHLNHRSLLGNLHLNSIVQLFIKRSLWPPHGRWWFMKRNEGGENRSEAFSELLIKCFLTRLFGCIWVHDFAAWAQERGTIKWSKIVLDKFGASKTKAWSPGPWSPPWDRLANNFSTDFYGILLVLGCKAKPFFKKLFAVMNYTIFGWSCESSKQKLSLPLHVDSSPKQW